MGQKTKENKQSGKALAQSSREILASSRPARDAYYKQQQSAVRTGGVGGNIPVLNAALDAADAGAQQTTDQTRSTLAKLNLGSAGGGITPGIAARGSQLKGRLRSDIINQMLGQAPNAALTAAQTGQAGLQQSANRNAGIAAANDASKSQAIAGGAAAAGAIAGAAIIAI